ncbi:MAG: TIGR00374 family protein, partial [Actinomycetaceae bacterium]|nr:TIGR00374 family protein [Actinomycetaceae bacterium]
MSEEQVHTQAPTPLSRLPQPVYVSDRISHRTHRSEDLVDFALSVAGILLVMVLGVYAHGTTTGVTEDVRSAFGGILRQLLLLPITLLESIFVLAIPISVVVSLAMRRRLRSIIEAILAGVSAAIATSLIIYLVPHLPSALTAPLTITTSTGLIVVIDLLIATLAAFFTVAGEASHMRSLRYGWAFILILAILYVLRGSLTLPAGIVSILLGRMIGTAARYAFGFRDDRADAIDLVDGLLHIGITPRQIVRADIVSAKEPLDTVCIVEDADTRSAWASPFLPLMADEEATDSAPSTDILVDTLPPPISGTDRHYV